MREYADRRSGRRWLNGGRLAGLALLLLLLVVLAVQVGVRLSSHDGNRSPEGPAPYDATYGIVTDANGPLAGALVRWKGTSQTALTDRNGIYRRSVTHGRVTAWKDGYFIAGQTLDPGWRYLSLTPLPVEDHDEYEWVDPSPRSGKGSCGNCHEAIYREWAASGHSRSASGRHFRNLYEGTDWNGENGVGWDLLNDHPLGAGVCASCHAPAIPPLDPGQLDLRELRGTALKGVHCDYCHKISGLGSGTIGLTHGRFNLRLLRPKPGEGQVFFGPLDDVDRGEESYSPFFRDSKYCASCHEGIVFGVHVYSTYSEWEQSPAARTGQQCQDCHMKPTGQMTNIAPGRGGIERDPKTLANHRFFDGSQADMLRRCVKVSVEVCRQEGQVRAEVRVLAEGVGHRVLTGFIDRHLLLIVEGRGEDGQEVDSEAGPRLPAAAGREGAGRPGRLFAKLLQDAEGHSPTPFWKAATKPVDTRLSPDQADISLYTYPASTHQIQVRVIYRRFWDEVARQKKWPDQDLLVFEQACLVR